MIRNLRRAGIIAGGVAAVILAVSGCSGPAGSPTTGSTGTDDPALAALIAAAQKEGTVTYYSSEVDAVNDELAKEFTAKYGIQVNMIRLASGPLGTRFSQEEESGGTQADVLRTADGGIFAENPQWFETLNTTDIPELAQYPANALTSNKDATLTQYNTFSINYNTNLVPADQVPQKWSDILDPKWKGKIVFSDPRASTSWMGWVGVMQKTFGDEWLKKLAAQDLTVIDSATPGAQQVAAGAFELSLPAYPGHATPIIQQGAPVASVQPTDPVLVKQDYIGLVKGAAHPNAAKLLLNFRLSPDFLEAACKLNKVGSPISGLPDCVDIPADAVPTQDIWTPEEEAPLLADLGLPQS